MSAANVHDGAEEDVLRNDADGTFGSMIDITFERSRERKGP